MTLVLRVLAGASLGLGVALLLRSRMRPRQRDYIHELLAGGRPDVDAVDLRDRLTAFAGWAASRLDTRGSVADKVAQARVPMSNGELATTTVLVTIGIAAGAWVLTGQWLLAVAVVAAAPAALNFWLDRRIRGRVTQFDADLPTVLSMIAGSLGAGHTFLRSLQQAADEVGGPVGDEFTIVLHETQLGASLVGAVQRLATRVDTESTHLLADAVRIQQRAGGSMAELLENLSDFLRVRDELDREVRVLTAEGRMSAFVLGGLPLFLLVAMQTVNPDYADPLWQGWGLVILGGCAASVAAGVALILRMSRIDV